MTLFPKKDDPMAQLDTPAAGGEPVNIDSSQPATDPIDALADSWFDDEEEKQTDAPAGEGAEPELTEADLPEGEQGDPAIAAPVSWTAEEKAKFGELPREVQETISRRETEREKFVQTKASEAQNARQTAERDAIAQVQTIAQQHAQAFQHLLPQVWPEPDPMLNIDDPIAYAEQLSAHRNSVAQYHQVQQRIQQATAQAQQAEQMLQAQARQEFNAVLSKEYPEFLDPTTGPKLREQLGSTALELGFPAEALADVNAQEVLAMKRATDWKAKADKYDALMAKKMETVREAKNLPRLSRPGSPPTRAQAGVKAVEASFERARNSKGAARTEAFADYLTKSGQL
jgi:hypothetical protein